MAIRTLVAALMIAAGAWVSAPAAADETADRQQVYDTVRLLLWRAQYDELEQLADRYRTESSRTGGGSWRIGVFYRALELAFETCEGDCARWVDDWIAAYPNSPTARLAYVSLRLYWTRLEANGAKDRLTEARRYLETHKAIAAQDPTWYEMMLEIAADQAWTRREFDALLDEARAKAPGYYPNYFAAVLYYLRYATNDAEEIEALANDAVARTRGTDATGLYARIYWFAGQAEYGWNLKVYSHVRWDAMRQGMDDVLQRYPDQRTINTFALFACAAQDYPLTRALMARIEGAPDSTIWGHEDWFETCKALAKDEG